MITAEIKAIQGRFWHRNVLKPPANRSGNKHFCSQWGCQVSIYVTKAYIKQCYLSNLSPGPEAGMYEVVVYYLHPFNLITWILTVWVLLDIGINEWCNSLVEGCVPFIIIINQRVNNQVLHRHIYTQIGYLGKKYCGNMVASVMVHLPLSELWWNFVQTSMFLWNELWETLTVCMFDF